MLLSADGYKSPDHNKVMLFIISNSLESTYGLSCSHGWPCITPATVTVNLCPHCHCLTMSLYRRKCKLRSNKNQAIIVVTPRRTAGINWSFYCNGDTIDCCGGAVKFNTENSETGSINSVLHCQPPPTS